MSKPRTADCLVVDDEPDMCWTMEQLLRSAGLRAVTAQSGGEVLSLLRELRFKLAFMDAKLPDIDGLELARMARAIDPEMRIVMVSGYYYHDDPIIQKALADGVFCGFLAKPFSNDDIVQIMRASLDVT